MLIYVTGASSGFGEAIARKLVCDGHRVVGFARRAQKLDQLQKELGTNFYAELLDVLKTPRIPPTLAQLPSEWQNPDALINNVGLALGTEPAHLARLDEWETMIATNCIGLVAMTDTLLPEMVVRGSGNIINIGSTAGNTPYPGGNVYGASKAFVEHFTRNLRADLLGTGVRTTLIAPGLCGGTEFSNVRLRGDDAKAASIYEGIRPLTASDVAETASWVLGLPAHVNINVVEMMPTCQGYGSLSIKR